MTYLDRLKIGGQYSPFWYHRYGTAFASLSQSGGQYRPCNTARAVGSTTRSCKIIWAQNLAVENVVAKKPTRVVI